MKMGIPWTLRLWTVDLVTEDDTPIAMVKLLAVVVVRVIGH